MLVVYKDGEDSHAAEQPPPYNPDDPPDVLIEARLELVYSVPEGVAVTEEDADEFAKVNSLLHAWPYWREYVQSSCLRLGVAPLLLGNFRVPSPYDPADEGSDTETPGE